MEMTERVARALAKLEGTSYSPSFKEEFDAKARTAIEAMRDPTDAMIKVGVDFALAVSLGGDYKWPQYIADKHRTMIDAALQEGSEPDGDLTPLVTRT